MISRRCPNYISDPGRVSRYIGDLDLAFEVFEFPVAGQ
jgi:hypothetical protein